MYILLENIKNMSCINMFKHRMITIQQSCNLTKTVKNLMISIKASRRH